MDTRSLIALGMLLATAVIALMKGAITGNDVKEVLILVGGGIMGVANQRRTEAAAKPAGALPAPPAVVAMLVVGALFLLHGCATVEGEKRVPMGCADPLSQDCDDPTAYPPITAMLPPWPFPRLLPEQQPYTPPPPTPAGRLLEKLAK